jgi:hypothetical protein
MRGRQEQQVIHHRGELSDQPPAAGAGRGVPQSRVALLAVGDPDGQIGGQVADLVAAHLSVHR